MTCSRRRSRAAAARKMAARCRGSALAARLWQVIGEIYSSAQRRRSAREFPAAGRRGRGLAAGAARAAGRHRWAPARARSKAMAWPSPEPAPVTTAACASSPGMWSALHVVVVDCGIELISARYTSACRPCEPRPPLVVPARRCSGHSGRASAVMKSDHARCHLYILTLAESPRYTPPPPVKVARRKPPRVRSRGRHAQCSLSVSWMSTLDSVPHQRG